VTPVGAFDQRSVESRTDVLVYTTSVLDRDWDVAGPVELVLHAATDVVDTDWTAKLVDVHPDGTAINVCDGIVRARHRGSFEEPTLLEIGKVYAYRVILGATAMRFRAGHAIRLEISSSNFPNYDVNMNRGISNHMMDPLDVAIATQVVLHDRENPSHLRLWVLGGPHASSQTSC
jgi:putative CocE/NonD family hydrolase